MDCQGHTKGQGPAWDSNSGLPDPKILSGSVVIKLSLLTKETWAWGLFWHKDTRGFVKNGSEEQAGARLKTGLPTFPWGSPEENFSVGQAQEDALGVRRLALISAQERRKE